MAVTCWTAGRSLLPESGPGDESELFAPRPRQVVDPKKLDVELVPEESEDVVVTDLQHSERWHRHRSQPPAVGGEDPIACAILEFEAEDADEADRREALELGRTANR